jgi:SAM-dependent methyltransferase
MKLVRIDPPGSWCQYDALMRLLDRCGGERFIEVGCGAGDLSLRLCRRGMSGIGVDFSEAALVQAREKLQEYIDAGRFRLEQGDLLELETTATPADVGISMMVMEHVEDELAFLRRLAQFVKPGGFVIIGVPGRRDRWGIEDETVGHLRRYDRDDLARTMTASGLTGVRVLSVAVPVANLLFHLGNAAVKRSPGETEKLGATARCQTETSGVREIPWKTMFPPWFRLILNPFTLWPLFVLQRLFYRTNLGLTMIGIGRVP